jgi:hypothetical protein
MTMINLSGPNAVPASHSPDDQAAVLRQYHRRQLLGHLIGPVLSILLHVVVVLLLTLLVKPERLPALEEVTAEYRLESVVELDPLVLDDLKIEDDDANAPIEFAAVEVAAPAVDAGQDSPVEPIDDAPMASDDHDFTDQLGTVAMNNSPLVILASWRPAAVRGAGRQ